MIRPVFLFGVALLGASFTQAIQSCSLEQKCPEDTPCCSQYGECGVGAYCLGGCDPRMSNQLDSCTPEPVCQSKTYPMDSMNGIVDISKYLGDPSKADWVYQGYPKLSNSSDKNLLLTMPANSVGTVLATSTYMWYGNVKAKLKTSRGPGVVTSFILLSDVKDEVDWEFVGAYLDQGQTNYYSQGIPVYTNEVNASSLDDVNTNWHTYEIDWTPDSVTWLVDGKSIRTKMRSDTYNATANAFNFPQTPARVQLSIWPAGSSSNAEGTITWAGGPIDWNSDDIQEFGYDFATVGEVTVQCYNAKSPPGTNTGVSYKYNNVLGWNDTVINGDDPTVLSSFQATGTNMTAGAGSSSTASGTAPIASIPGGGSSGNGGGQVVGGGGDGGSGESPTNTGSSPGCAATDFCTGSGAGGGAGDGTSDGPRIVGHTLGASAFGIVVAVAGLLWL